MKKFIRSASNIILLASLILGASYFTVIAAVTNKIPSPIALYEDSLQSAISSSATSFTLVRGTDVAGTSLATNTYGFIIDEGSASEEFVLADCTATACTNAIRGVSPITGLTAVTSLQKSHRRGAVIKMTDAPILLILKRIINGEETLPNKITYTSHPTFSADADIVDKKYVDDTAFSGAGVVDATTTARGVSELATSAEINAGTATGGSGNLVVAPSQLASSIYNTQLPSSGQKDALAGTSGTPSSSNKYVTQASLPSIGNAVGGQFGGTGADGALSVTSGTTTIDLGNAAIVTKNYTSISISSGATLAFTNPNTNGTRIILKSQGAVTIAGTIDASGMGADGGTGGATSNGGGGSGKQALGVIGTETQYGTGGSTGGAGTAGTRVTLRNLYAQSEETVISHITHLIPGAGGGGGTGGNNGGANTITGGSGGKGGGAVLIECAGALNFTGTINTSGLTGTAGTDFPSGSLTTNYQSGAGGGGGSAGMQLIIYNTLTANTGTMNASGGNGGAGGALTSTGGTSSGSESTSGAGSASFASDGVAGVTTATNGTNAAGLGAGASGGGGRRASGTNTTGGTGGGSMGGLVIKNTMFF